MLYNTSAYNFSVPNDEIITVSQKKLNLYAATHKIQSEKCHSQNFSFSKT